MADPVYKNVNFVFQSKGIHARWVDDQPPPGFWENMDNTEELAETSIGNRLGTAIINRTGTVVETLPGPVHSIAKLASISGSDYRYAGVGETLWRRQSLTQGPYTEIVASDMSGNPWTYAVDQPSDYTALPFVFFADANGMLKDNGTLTAPQQMGIFQPQFPIQAYLQAPPVQVTLDDYTTPPGDYTYTGISGGSTETLVNTTVTFPIFGGGPGIETVEVADGTQVGQFQLLTIDTGGNQETVLVLLVQNPQGTGTTITAYFAKHHSGTVPATAAALGITVPASTTATAALAFGGLPIPYSETNVQNMSDYIGLYLYVTDPTQVQSITLKFDCGDGSFNSDYFYKVIAQGPLQNLLESVNDPTTAATDAILADSLDLYGNSAGSIAQLNSGLDNWTPLLIQLSDFAGAGRADYGDPVFNWANVNGYQITVVTNDGASVNVYLGSLVLFGGAGPDVFAGVAYDYLFTYFNNVDGTESNPCMVMSNVNPPNQTNWVYPRRMPVLVKMQFGGYLPDAQTTSVRVYRRGGTLGDNYRRLAQIDGVQGMTGVNYIDTASDADIEEADFVSFTNDVPVTSSLPYPVNTTITNDLSPQFNPVTGLLALTRIPVNNYSNISIGQQVSIGNVTDPNYETVIVVGFSEPAGNYFLAPIQNSHSSGEPVTATAKYGQPVTIIAQAFNQMWFAGDPNNQNSLYWSAASNPQAVSSAAYVAVSTPDDPITAIVQFKGNLYVSTLKGWWAVAPGSNANQSPTIYPTACKHGCVAPLGFCVTEEAIFYCAIDGIRAFAGGASTYLTQDQEFIFQGIGSSPIVEANFNELNQTRMAYWNNMIFVSYIGVDGNRHRVILQTQYKRWRNDDLDVQSLLLEVDTNTLVFGDSVGLVHLDRQDQAYDEGNNAGVLTQKPIAINLQSPYSDQGEPSITKSYQELTLDINTNGQTLFVYLWFEDGETSAFIGTVRTAERQKVNFPLNNGLGFEYYKVSLQLAGNVLEFIYIYQCSVKFLPLAKTRQSIDTFQLRLGTDESKVAKQVYWEYTSEADIDFAVYYDDAETPGFTFTLPNSNGARNALRRRLPAISFRMIRFIGLCEEDFQIWESSKIEFKPLCQGKGYQVIEFVPNG